MHFIGLRESLLEEGDDPRAMLGDEVAEESADFGGGAVRASKSPARYHRGVGGGEGMVHATQEEVVHRCEEEVRRELRSRHERSERQEVIAAHHGVDEGDVGGVGGTRVFGNPRSEVSNESITSSSVHVRILQGVLER